MPRENLVRDVSDTARWVAVKRATESERPDALFRDPLAGRLAGPRGHAIDAAMPRALRPSWPLVVRTRLIDDLVEKCVAEGCDRVVNLAAGFDTRPYRMALPASLSWVEADLAPLIDEKERLLANEKPRCQVRRERIDLADEGARTAFLREATTGAEKVLVITEGLLMYLDEDVVRRLAADLHTHPSIRWWMLDLHSVALRAMMQKQNRGAFANAPIKFGPEGGVAWFEARGWRARDIASVLREAARHKRLPFLMQLLIPRLPDPDPRNMGRRDRWYGIVRFERA